MKTVTPDGTLVLPMKRLAEAADFESIMRLHERQVLAVAMRITGNLEDAQDVAQEVFLRLHRSLHLLPDDTAAGPWLRRVTVNLCLDLARRRKVRRPAPLGEDLVAGVPGPEMLAVRAREKDMLGAALARLGKRERAALVLRDMEGLSTSEVAEALGTTESTIRVQISKARLKLREWLRGLR